MNQLRESRRKEDFKYFIEIPSRPHTVDDIMHTRVTGQHQRWPVDADTTERLRTLGQREVYCPKFPLWTLAAAVALSIGGIYGVFLLWSSL